MNEFLLSILVPTHNRSSYAIPCVKSLLSIHSGLVQIVVHDTSDDDCELKSWAEGISDQRLKYVYHADRLSMTDNHEKCLSYADGEYLILIGDDDSVSSFILDIVEFSKNNAIDVLVPRITATYSWPDFKTRFYGNAHAGKLYLDSFTCSVDKMSAKDRLRDSLADACQGTDMMPKLYHGLVRKDIIDSIVNMHGRFFHGTSPDMSASVGLAIAIDYYHIIDFPFTLPGASGKSNTGRSALNKHKGDLDNDEHMKPFKDLYWPGFIPKFFSVETVWAQSAWVSLEVYGEIEYLKVFNLPRLYALCFIKHRGYFSLIRESIQCFSELRNDKVRYPVIAFEAMHELLSMFRIKMLRLTSPSASAGKVVVGVFENVELAQKSLDDVLGSSDCYKKLGV